MCAHMRDGASPGSDNSSHAASKSQGDDPVEAKAPLSTFFTAKNTWARAAQQALQAVWTGACFLLPGAVALPTLGISVASLALAPRHTHVAGVPGAQQWFGRWAPAGGRTQYAAYLGMHNTNSTTRGSPLHHSPLKQETVHSLMRRTLPLIFRLVPPYALAARRKRGNGSSCTTTNTGIAAMEADRHVLCDPVTMP